MEYEDAIGLYRIVLYDALPDGGTGSAGRYDCRQGASDRESDGDCPQDAQQGNIDCAGADHVEAGHQPAWHTECGGCRTPFAGADVKDYGGIGGLKTVSIRNMGAAHTAVSYDGVAVSNCQAGQIDIGRFSLDNVSMLSLSIGQSEDLLQSARLYASAGVLNIETEKPHFEGDRTSAFLARVRGGSFGYVAPSVRWWQKLGERTRLSVDAGYMRADGNYPFTLVNGKYVTKEKRNNSEVESWQGEATLYHTFKDDGELDVKGYYYYSARELPGGVTLYNPISDENYGMRTSLHKRVIKRSFLLSGHYRRRPNTITVGIAIGTRGWNILMGFTGKYIVRMNITCRQPCFISHWRT